MSSAREQIDSLLRTQRQYVDVSLEGDTLRVHARVMRVEDGERFVVIDYRATMPNALKSELNAVLARIQAISVLAQRADASAAGLQVLVLADCDTATGVSTDTLLQTPLRDFDRTTVR